MNLEQALAEVITSTGPIGTLIVAAAYVLRLELRRVADRLTKLEKRDDELHENLDDLHDRVRELEVRKAVPSFLRVEPTPAAGEMLT